jgi:hypothetical protein
VSTAKAVPASMANVPIAKNMPLLQRFMVTPIISWNEPRPTLPE